MKRIFLLSRQDIMLAEEEVISLTKNEHTIIGNLLVSETDLDLRDRLAYTHKIYTYLFETQYDNLSEAVEGFPWQTIYKNSFSVRMHGCASEEKTLAKLIWNRLKNPKVSLKSPGTPFEFFKLEDKIIAGILEGETDKSFLKRKSHLMPKSHPTSMHPALARACVNLAGVIKGRILDPFCGAGGILIEAGLIGHSITGYDIDSEMLDRCRQNLRYYGIKDYTLEKKDATKAEVNHDAIVTDLPYGRNSKTSIKNLLELYQNFLINAQKVTSSCVIIFPDFIDYKQVLSQTSWKVKKAFRHYVHKSLTRVILKLVR